MKSQRSTKGEQDSFAELTKLPAKEFEEQFKNWMERDDVARSLQAKLRADLIMNFNKTALGKHIMASTSYAGGNGGTTTRLTIPPLLLGLHTLVAEFLYTENCHFSLSVFCTEVPYRNALPDFEKMQHFRFAPNEIDEILTVIFSGLEKYRDADNVMKIAIRKAYLHGGKVSLLLIMLNAMLEGNRTTLNKLLKKQMFTATEPVSVMPVGLATSAVDETKASDNNLQADFKNEASNRQFHHLNKYLVILSRKVTEMTDQLGTLYNHHKSTNNDQPGGRHRRYKSMDIRKFEHLNRSLERITENIKLMGHTKRRNKHVDAIVKAIESLTKQFTCCAANFENISKLLSADLQTSKRPLIRDSVVYAEKQTETDYIEKTYRDWLHEMRYTQNGRKFLDRIEVSLNKVLENQRTSLSEEMETKLRYQRDYLKIRYQQKLLEEVIKHEEIHSSDVSIRYMNKKIEAHCKRLEAKSAELLDKNPKDVEVNEQTQLQREKVGENLRHQGFSHRHKANKVPVSNDIIHSAVKEDVSMWKQDKRQQQQQQQQQSTEEVIILSDINHPAAKPELENVTASHNIDELTQKKISKGKVDQNQQQQLHQQQYQQHHQHQHRQLHQHPLQQNDEKVIEASKNNNTVPPGKRDICNVDIKDILSSRKKMHKFIDGLTQEEASVTYVVQDAKKRLQQLEHESNELEQNFLNYLERQQIQKEAAHNAATEMWQHYTIERDKMKERSEDILNSRQNHQQQEQAEGNEQKQQQQQQQEQEKVQANNNDDTTNSENEKNVKEFRVNDTQVIQDHFEIPNIQEPKLEYRNAFSDAKKTLFRLYIKDKFDQNPIVPPFQKETLLCEQLNANDDDEANDDDADDDSLYRHCIETKNANNAQNINRNRNRKRNKNRNMNTNMNTNMSMGEEYFEILKLNNLIGYDLTSYATSYGRRRTLRDELAAAELSGTSSTCDSLAGQTTEEIAQALNSYNNGDNDDNADSETLLSLSVSDDLSKSCSSDDTSPVRMMQQKKRNEHLQKSQRQHHHHHLNDDNKTTTTPREEMRVNEKTSTVLRQSMVKIQELFARIESDRDDYADRSKANNNNNSNGKDNTRTNSHSQNHSMNNNTKSRNSSSSNTIKKDSKQKNTRNSSHDKTSSSSSGSSSGSSSSCSNSIASEQQQDKAERQRQKVAVHEGGSQSENVQQSDTPAIIRVEHSSSVPASIELSEKNEIESNVRDITAQLKISSESKLSSSQQITQRAERIKRAIASKSIAPFPLLNHGSMATPRPSGILAPASTSTLPLKKTCAMKAFASSVKDMIPPLSSTSVQFTSNMNATIDLKCSTLPVSSIRPADGQAKAALIKDHTPHNNNNNCSSKCNDDVPEIQPKMSVPDVNQYKSTPQLSSATKSTRCIIPHSESNSGALAIKWSAVTENETMSNEVKQPVELGEVMIVNEMDKNSNSGRSIQSIIKHTTYGDNSEVGEVIDKERIQKKQKIRFADIPQIDSTRNTISTSTSSVELTHRTASDNSGNDFWQ